MRKLKTLLILMFAACLTFTLFACGGGEEDQGYTLNTVRATKQIELTDADTQETFNEKMKTYTLTGTTDEGRVDILGSECDITGTIGFGEVDRYTVTFKPREHNENGATAEAVVVIDHDWGPEEDGVSVCQYASCGATKDTKKEDISIHYGNFHTGTGIGPSGPVVDAETAIPQVLLTAEQAAAIGLHEEKSTTSVFNPDAGINEGVTSTGRITNFGYDVRANKIVPTLTAGDLAPGMSITIEGYAKTDVAEATQTVRGGPWNVVNGNWNAPSYGIADPYSPLCTLANGGIDVGTAVIVRSEGWVLYNGIGQELDNTLGGLPKFISGGSATESGSTEAANCASWEGATADILDGQDVTNRPAYTSSDWKDWWVYSEGQDRHSLDSYQSFTHVRVTWTYHTYKLNPEDENSEKVGIIVIDSDYLDAGTTLRSYIKVPAATRGAYRTIIHGDYSTLLITSSTYVETETVTDMRITGLKAGAKTEYLEGEQIDAGAVFNMELKSKQNTDWHASGIALTNDMLYYYAGETQTREAAEADVEAKVDTDFEAGSPEAQAAVWKQVGNNPLTKNMKFFKVVLNRGDAHCNSMVPAEAAITIVENNVKDAVGDQYTALDSRDLMATYTRAAGKDAEKKTTVDLAIERAIFRAIPAEAIGSENTFKELTDATDYRFTTIRIRGIAANGFSSITEEETKGHAADGTKGDYYYAFKAEGDDVLLAIAIKATMRGDALVITGVQPTPIRFTFGTTSLGFDVSSTISTDKPTLNNGCEEVTIIYKNLPAGGNFVVRSGDTQTGSVSADKLKTNANTNGTVPAEKQAETALGTSGVVATYYKVDGTGNETTTTVKFKFPAFDFANWTTMPYIRATNQRSQTLAEDYVEYDLSAGITANNNNSESGVYFAEKDGTLYFVTAHTGTGEVEKEEYVVNINNGVKATAKSFNLAYEDTVAGIAFKDKALGEAVAIREIALSKAASDYGVLVVVSINVKAATGIEGDYGFQIVGDNNNAHYWKYNATDKTIAQTTIEGSLKQTVLEEGDCFTKGIVASEVQDGGKTVFYAQYQEIAGEHEWSGDTCSKCGATKTAKTLTFDENNCKNELVAGHFIEVSGKYNTTPHSKPFNGIETNIRQKDGDAFYVRVRNDGYYARETGEDAQATLLYNSTPSNTVNGVPNGIDGKAIEADTDYVEAKKGGTFRVVAYFVGGDTRVVTVVTSLWRADQTAFVDTPYFTYTAQIKIGGSANSVYVNFRFDNFIADGQSVTGLGSDGTVDLVSGEISGNTLQNYEYTSFNAKNGENAEAAFDLSENTVSEQIEDYIGAYEKGKLPTYAKRLVPAGKAGTLSEAQKTALGIPATGNEIDYFYSFTAGWTKGAGETEARIIDLSTGSVYEYGYVKLDTDKVYVVIPYDETKTRFMLDFENTAMYTKQSDLVIDLGRLSVGNVTLTKPAADIFGGEVEITVGGTVNEGANLYLGNESVAWSALSTEQTLGALKVKLEGTTLKVTVPKADLTKTVEGYTLILRTARGGMLAQVEIDPLNVPSSPATGDLRIEGFYVIADGNKLTFVKTDATANSTQNLVLNINDGTANGLLDNYDVTVQINGAGGAAFLDYNDLTVKGTVVWSQFGSSRLLAITFDLSDYEGKAYGFQVGADTTNIYTVQDGAIAAVAKENAGGTNETPAVGSHAQRGVEAKLYSQGDVKFYYDLEITEAGHIFPVDATDNSGYEGLKFYEGTCEREGCDETEGVSGWKVEGVQVGKKDNSVGYDGAHKYPHGKNLSYNPAKGQKYSVIKKGQKIIAEGVTTSSMAGNWSSVAVLLYRGAEAVDGMHFRYDNYVMNAGGSSGGDYDDWGWHVAPSVTSGSGTVDWAAAQVAASHGRMTIVWDWTQDKTITITITCVGMVNDYTHIQTYTITSTQPSGEFSEDVYAIGITPDGGSFYGTITCEGPHDDQNPNPAKTDATGSVVIPEDNPEAVEPNDYTIPTIEATGWTGGTALWTTILGYGQKATITGKMTLIASDGAQVYHGILPYVAKATTKKAVSEYAAFRYDNWANNDLGGDPFNSGTPSTAGNMTLVKTSISLEGASQGVQPWYGDQVGPDNEPTVPGGWQLRQALDGIKGETIKIVIDYTVEKTITITISFTTNCALTYQGTDKADHKFEVVYTLNATVDSVGFAEIYTIGLGGEQAKLENGNCKIEGTAQKPTAHTHDYDETTHVCACGEIDPEHLEDGHSYNHGVCVCGTPCPHANVQGTTCNDCHATVATSTVTTGTPANYWIPGGGDNHDQVTYATTIEEGKQYVYTAQYAASQGTNVWRGAICMVQVGTQNYGLRYIDGWSPDTVADGQALSLKGGDYNYDTHAQAALDGTYMKVIVELKDGVLTITLTQYASTDAQMATPVATRIMTVSGCGSETVKFAVVDADGTSFVSNTMNLSTYSWAN